MVVSFTVFVIFHFGEIIRETKRSWGLFPPPLGHPHCDNDVLPAIGLGLSQCARPPRGDSLAQEGGHYFTKKKGFLLSSYFLYPFPENQRGSDLKKSPSLNTIVPPMITVRGKRAK